MQLPLYKQRVPVINFKKLGESPLNSKYLISVMRQAALFLVRAHRAAPRSKRGETGEAAEN